MWGLWHLVLGLAFNVTVYYFVRASLTTMLLMTLLATFPDLDITFYTRYVRENGEWKKKRGIGGHRDGLFHSALLPVAVFVGYLVDPNVTAAEFHLAAYLAAAVMSHLVGDFKHGKGTIRFFGGKFVLRGFKSHAWLAVNAAACLAIVLAVVL